MNKSIVRCRCGHQVLSKEVLRTDLYERRAPGDSSRDYVYVKYRCRRCKRMGETFVAESRWDWAMLEAEPNEMTDQERDRFLDEEVVTSEDILDFHRQLDTFSLSDLSAMTNEDIENTIPDSVTSKEEETEVSNSDAPNIDAANVDSVAEPITEQLSPTPEMRATLKVENTKAETLSSVPHPPDEPQKETRRKRP